MDGNRAMMGPGVRHSFPTMGYLSRDSSRRPSREEQPEEDDDILERQPGEKPPAWLIAACSDACSTEATHVAYSRACNGWCCRRFPVEALLFGVMMPLALAGYWLRDTTMIGEETGQNPGGEDQWLEASCTLRQLMLEPRMIYHHGKFKDAKNKEYQARASPYFLKAKSSLRACLSCGPLNSGHQRPLSAGGAHLAA